MNFIDLKTQYISLKKEIDIRIATVLQNGNFLGGSEVDLLSQQLARYCGVKHCITCSNGNDALAIALHCLGISRGDAVFLPTFCSFATAEPISLSGATPIFVDVDKKTFTIDPVKLENAILKVQIDGKLKPKAAVAVDLFGTLANYSAIKKITRRYSLHLIEDAAQGFGAQTGEQKACSFGDISITSFSPSMALGGYGDGAALFTNNDDYAEILHEITRHGYENCDYDNRRIGFNSHLNSIQAAILLAKLRAFKEFELKERQKIANTYSNLLKDDFEMQRQNEGSFSSWSRFTILVENSKVREQIIAKLKDADVPTKIYYPLPIHRQAAYASYDFNLKELAISNALCDQVLSLPMHPYLKAADIESICEKLIAAKNSLA